MRKWFLKITCLTTALGVSLAMGAPATDQEYKTPLEAARAISGFKTYNGVPLPKILAQHGIDIGHAIAFQEKPPGTWDWVLFLKSRSTARLPCGARTPADWTLEFSQRGRQMPVLSPNDDGILTWLTTGKCPAN